jgi:hypothetical protein
MVGAVKAQFPPEDTVWFRGESDVNWTLHPSLCRSPCRLDHELTLYKRFRQKAHQFLTTAPKTEWEWLFLMQHYSLQTRLLDWSENPLVALYFAVANINHDKKDGRVWCFLPKTYNQRLYHIQTTISSDIPEFDVDDILEDFLFANIGRPGNTMKPPIAALAAQQFARITAQHGVFVVFHNHPDSLDKWATKTELFEFKVPKANKAALREELTHLRVDRLAMFPDLGEVANAIKQSLGI